ncbi:ABC transporter ATP-binding protein [Microtetraspora sp. NBRC 16547]|uniref:ABC transporter ATP-binding protein n=1 Tax=Microtetraspora sp. NBRC 16547 TaxID=3030993 RepID=UPI0024A2EB15|nr:ABC transporter ATP-binding protein [Microtetraspora sp. NBRC 16547]GLW97129.1 sugar ABC transporter ATP-binding protein [Microtetraspora sp. NBRC 16547]
MTIDERARELTPPTTPALRLRGISKRYGPVVASDGVDLDVHHGEIHGLLGENGAGKSTLMKILLGLVKRDSGTILRGEEPADITSPQEAVALGIGMVHQHFSLIDALTVWENVILGDTGKIDRTAACRQVEEVSRRYGLPIDPLARVDRLSAGERQRVELIKCLRRDPSVLILDEPTSVLTQAESAELFTVLRQVVRTEDRAVILISHKLAEITAATDRVTVLRKGRVVFHSETSATTPQELARQMVGRDVSLRAEGAALGLLPVDGGRPADTGTAPDTALDTAPDIETGTAPDTETGTASPAPGVVPALRLRDLTVTVDGVTALSDLSLDIAPGEILGLYGVEGNGQSVLGDLLSGLVLPTSGTVEVGGRPVELDRPGALHRAGLGIIPEDRHSSGVVLDMSIAENLVMKSLGDVSGRGFISRRKMYGIARRLAAEFNIVAPSMDTPVRSLSGGNQQRVVLARELSAGPSVLVAAQPTHGLDVGAIEDMYQRLQDAASGGVAVLLISTELEEVMALASRIAVICSGRITGVLPTGEATAERLGMLVGGVAA